MVSPVWPDHGLEDADLPGKRPETAGGVFPLNQIIGGAETSVALATVPKGAGLFDTGRSTKAKGLLQGLALEPVLNGACEGGGDGPGRFALFDQGGGEFHQGGGGIGGGVDDWRRSGVIKMRDYGRGAIH